MIYAVQQFGCYILGREWTLITDHQALQHLKMTKNPSGRRARWIMTLMEFSPYISQYRKGKLNGAADAISRLFPPKIKKDTNNTVAAITRAQVKNKEDITRDPGNMGKTRHPRNKGKTRDPENRGATEDSDNMSRTANSANVDAKEQKADTLQAAKDIAKEQEKDSFCGPIMTYLLPPQNETQMRKEESEQSRHMAVYGLARKFTEKQESRRFGKRYSQQNWGATNSRKKECIKPQNNTQSHGASVGKILGP